MKLPRNERVARLFASAVFVSIGAFAVTIGAHDALVGIEVGSRFGGILLLAAGGLMLSVGLVQPMPRFESATTAGVLVAPAGVFTGLSLLAAQLLSLDGDLEPVLILLLAVLAVNLGSFALVRRAGRRRWLPALASAVLLGAAYLYLRHGDRDERIVFWVAIATASCLVAGALWNAKRPDFSVSFTRIVVGTVGFFSLGALISAVQLWYATQYVPNRQMATLTVESELRQLDPIRGMEVAEMRVTVTNTSETQAKILGSVYRVTGSRVRAARPTNSEFAAQLNRPQLGRAPVLRHRRLPSWKLVQVGQVFPEGFWLEPDEKFSTEALINVPRGRYDVLRSQTELKIAKGSALTLDEQPRQRFPFRVTTAFPYSGISFVWPIEETSWFRDLTRADRELEVRWLATGRSLERLARFPRLEAIVSRIDEQRDSSEFVDYNEKAARFYGIFDTISTAEVPLQHRSGA